MATSRYRKQKTPVALFVFLFILLILAGYFVSGLYKLEGANIANLGDNLTVILAHPFRNWANEKTPACIGIGICGWFAFVSYYLAYYRNFQYNQEHGSEDWDDARRYPKGCRKRKKGDTRILSRHLEVPLDGGLSNNNLLIVGSSGAYKTTGFLHPNILKMQSTYVVLDVKGDTQRKLGKKFLAADTGSVP